MNLKKLFTFSLLCLILVSCESEPEVIEKPKPEQPRGLKYFEKSKTPNKLRYNLPSSRFYFPIEITKIDFIQVNGVFEIQNDKFAESKPIPGLRLVVKYKMTNPYSRVIVAHIPDYYYITAPHLENYMSRDAHTSERDCECEIDNGSEITFKGKPLPAVSEKRESYFCMTFQPNETKEFKVVFNDPFAFYLSKVTFFGFTEDKSWVKEDVEAGVEIDVETKTITRLAKVYHW